MNPANFVSMGMRSATLAAALSSLAAGPARAHDDATHHKMQQAAATTKAGTVKVRGLDATLLDQEGRSLHLGREVIGQKIVVVNFVYTACTTVCPLASALFADLQGRLGDALGREVALVTLTVDPVRDTPATLKAQAAKYQARAGWVWLTGPSVAVNDVLRGMGAYASDFTQHPLMVLVGDGATGTWTRFAGTPDPKRLALHVQALQQARAAKAAGG